MHLILRMSFWLNSADAALEDVIPAHIKEVGQFYILSTRNITDLEFLTIFFIYNHYSIRIMAVIQFPLQPYKGSNLQTLPHFVSIVIHSASQVAVHKIQFLYFHNLNH